MMKNLIFVSKDTGLECLKFHLSHFKNDDNFIVACNPDKQRIIDFLEESNCNFCDIDDFSFSALKKRRYDWLLNLWGGYIFKKDILSIVDNSLNIHPSYLPYGRGRDPVVWAIRDNVPAGVTLHEISEKVDEGSIWYQEKTPYHIPIKGNFLYKNVIDACVRVFKAQWPLIRELKYSKEIQQAIDKPTRRRKDLLEDQTISYETLTEDQKDFLSRVMAHDFGEEYSSILDMGGRRYNIAFIVKEINEK